jgi:hypothetical protein
VASEVVEDVELARRIKQKGLKLRYGVGLDLATSECIDRPRPVGRLDKKTVLGSRRNLFATLYTAVIVLWTCTGPWLGLLLSVNAATAAISWLKLLAIVLP